MLLKQTYLAEGVFLVFMHGKMYDCRLHQVLQTKALSGNRLLPKSCQRLFETKAQVQQRSATGGELHIPGISTNREGQEF